MLPKMQAHPPGCHGKSAPPDRILKSGLPENIGTMMHHPAISPIHFPGSLPSGYPKLIHKSEQGRSGFRKIADFSRPVEIGRHTSELQSLMRISYAVFCLNKKTNPT